jgi:SAM-dependent methyltransferase
MSDEPGALWRNADRRRARFDANAQAYDTHRPGYPEESFDDLVSIAALSPGDPVVEIGSGTGIATLPLARRGLAVTCVEPGPAMAALARDKLAGFTGIEFIAARFEDWQAPPQSARAVVAANAWHWIAPEAGYRQAASVLGPSGCLCLLLHHVVQVGPDGFSAALKELRDSIAPLSEAERQAGSYLEHKVWADDMEASGYFVHLATTRHAFTRQLSARQFVDVTNTYGPNSQLAAADLARWEEAAIRLIDQRYGGRIAKTEEAVLTVGRRMGD